MKQSDSARKPSDLRALLSKIIGRSVLLLGLTSLSGCLSTVSQINNLVAESMGSYAAPTLAATPTPSGCDTSRCAELDQLEADLYTYARNGQMTWLNLVDHFYTHRAKLYPNSNDANGVSEMHAYQRMLAEQMDNRQITELQWQYLITQKNAEINQRIQQNATNRTVIQQQPTAPATAFPKKCWTTKSGNNFYTTCN